VIKLAPTLGYEIEERQIDVNDLFADIRAGKVTEAFGSGTAAVITPVGRLCYKDECLQLAGGKVGEITQKLYDTLTGIQTGKIADTFGWVRFIK
jgi:branched-chain amino acid aminotransferase